MGRDVVVQPHRVRAPPVVRLEALHHRPARLRSAQVLQRWLQRTVDAPTDAHGVVQLRSELHRVAPHVPDRALALLEMLLEAAPHILYSSAIIGPAT